MHLRGEIPPASPSACTYPLAINSLAFSLRVNDFERWSFDFKMTLKDDMVRIKESYETHR